jgi:spermidine/putrescine transport system permease protein
MTNPYQTIVQSSVGHASARLGRWLWRLWFLNESLRGYVLLLPTLLFVFVMLMIALVTLGAQSFWVNNPPGDVIQYTVENYSMLLTPHGEMYRVLLVRSLWLSLMMTISVILFTYPIAYVLAFHVHKHKVFWLIAISIPFWISYLLRVFSWKVILQHEGVINSILLGLGIINEPLDNLLHNRTAVVITLTHAWAAFAILPIYVSLEKIDRTLLEAASDLGDGFMRRFGA